MSTALITSGSRGIGLGLVRQLLARPVTKYPLILVTSRTAGGDELEPIVAANSTRVKRLVLPDVGNVEQVKAMVSHLKALAPKGVNILINNAARVGPPARLPSLSGTIELQEQLNTNALGPALVVSTLWSSNLLRAPPNAPPKGINFPPPNVSPLGLSGPREEWGYEFEQARAPTTAPHYEPTGDIPNVPIVVNLWSTQGSLKWTGELWEGGSTRDDLIFHPVYAASKAALSGVSMQLAREMRNDAIVNCIHPGWVRTRYNRDYAPLSSDESANKILDLIESWRTTRDSGQWLNEEGQKVPF